MKRKFQDNEKMRPILDLLERDYKKYLVGSLSETIAQFPIEHFSKEKIEFIFQLIEAELRATDAIHLKRFLENLKQGNEERWVLLSQHAENVELGKTSSAVSHQLIALIELTEEGR